MSPLHGLTELFLGLLLFNYCYGQGSQYNTEDQPREPLLCYRCVYDVRMGQIGGDMNCQDTLKKRTAEEESCVGSCYKKYIALDAENYSYSRGCMKNCQSHSGKSTYIECCGSRLCNGGNSASRNLLSRGIYTLVVCTLVALWTGLFRLPS